MAQTVFILIDSSIPSVSLGILENGTTFTYSYAGTGEGIQFSPYTIELGAGGLMAFNVPKEGKSAVFGFDEIISFEINGADQLTGGTPAADLQDVIDRCLPFFVEGVAEIAIDYPITSATTSLDFSTIGGANIVNLTSADATATIALIENIPANREIQIIPPVGMTLTFTRTQLAAFSADWQILTSASHVCEGAKGERIWVQKWVSASWTTAFVSRFLTNIL